MFLLCLLGPQKSASFPSGLARRLQGPGAPGGAGALFRAPCSAPEPAAEEFLDAEPMGGRLRTGFAEGFAGGDALEIDPAAMIQ